MEQCKLCKEEVDQLHEHHIVPGLETPDNKIRICSDCHFKIHHPDKEDADLSKTKEAWVNAMSRKREDIFREGWAIIPNVVVRDPNLSDSAKILYAEISSLCALKGYCYASNKYFAEKFKVSQRTITRHLTELEPYVLMKDRGGGGSRRKMYVHLLGSTSTKMSKYQEEDVQVNIDKNVQQNNNKEEKITRDIPIVEKDITIVLEYLNTVTGKDFKPTTEAHRRVIRGRMKEGFTVQDFKKVIDIKHAKWGGKKWQRDGEYVYGDDFLRPSTLFSPTKFEGYVNERMPEKADSGEPLNIKTSEKWQKRKTGTKHLNGSGEQSVTVDSPGNQ